MTTETTIVHVGPIVPGLVAELATRYEAVPLDTELLESPGCSDVQIAVTSSKVGLSTETMRKLNGLRAVLNFGAGYDKLDIEQAVDRGIAVSYTPGVSSPCVADLAVGALIDIYRGLAHADRFVRAGHWATGDLPPLGRRVAGTRVGILGLGRIGGTVARRLSGFDVSIGYCNRQPSTEGEARGYRYYSSPVEMARESDCLILCAAGGPDTHALVSDQVLHALGPNGFLVNVSRGSIVDDGALIAALRTGGIAGAALDVHEVEPGGDPALAELDNVLILPHIGSATRETRADMEGLVLANLDQFLRSGSLLTPVPGSVRTAATVGGAIHQK